jgi:PAS domain S-box-containing protein
MKNRTRLFDKQPFFIVISICMILFFSAGGYCLYSGEAQVIRLARKHLTTIIVDNYYPYTFMNAQGIADGFSVDLIRAVTQAMGLEIDIKAGTWDQARTALEAGEIDMLPMMAYSEERNKVFDFSQPHTISFDAVFVVKGKGRFQSIADLMGKTVIVMKNDVAHDYLISRGVTPPEKIVLTDSLPDALRLLALGKGDATLMPKLVGLLHLKKLGIVNLEPSSVVVDDYQRRFSFAVKKGDNLLLHSLSDGLSIVKAAGMLDQIHQKWFGLVEPSPITLQSVMKYILFGFAALMLIVLIFIVWSLSLRKQVSLRTRKLEQEIAEHKQAKDNLLETKQRLELATASGKMGVWDWNIQNNILQWDDQMFELYGITRNTFPVRAKDWRNSLHPDDREMALEAIRAAFKGEKDYDAEFRIVHPDGTVKFIKAHAIIIRNNAGKAIKMIGISRDITERKRSEEELLHINETLEQRVTQEVKKNIQHEFLLIQQSRLAAMGEMIGNIAHQWRQPLNALGLLIFNIKDAYQFNSLDAAYLDKAVADGNRMVQKMSTTISDFSNFFRPDKKITVFSALEQIKEAISLVESSFQNSNITIHIDASHDLNLLGFPNEYSQMLLNLFSNAKEAILARNKAHRHPSGRVDIVLTEQDGQGCVTVRDNGGGIPAEILDRIFDPYFSTKESGTGIGLYMSKMIIERNMKGGITVRNIEGGAEFIIASPLAAKNKS